MILFSLVEFCFLTYERNMAGEGGSDWLSEGEWHTGLSLREERAE